MRFVIVIDKKLTEINKYPRKDISEPLTGFDGEIYVLLDNKPIEEYYESLAKTEIRLTDEVYEDYSHLLIAYQDYISVQRPYEFIIETLNNDIGAYLDENYPVWERDKHARDILFAKADPDKDKYIKDLDKWIDDCRVERDRREKEFQDKQVIPELGNYPEKPINN